MSVLKGKKFLLEGHRGVQSLYPENTLASFQAAIDLGVDFVELDLLASLDGEIVIHHDYEVDGRLIHAMTKEEIKQVHCGGVNREFPLQQPVPDAKIPLLKELFEMVRESNLPHAKKICFNLEIKSDPKHPEYTLRVDLLAQKIVQIVRDFGLESRVYYSSFNPEVLSLIKTIDSKAVIALLYLAIMPLLFLKGEKDSWLISLLETCSKIGAQIISPNETILNGEVIQIFKEARLLVIPWTVNEVSRYNELVGIGVDGIITDYPQRFLTYTGTT
jgi:glycerophosphoryl diester phosphodiesterase